MPAQELKDKQIVEKLWQYGHFANPSFPDLWNVKESDLPQLSLGDPIVQQALLSYQDKNSYAFERLSFEEHARPANVDGNFGPATNRLLQLERCGHPDYGMLPELGGPRAPVPAVGSGNWPRCHNIGNFHAAIVRVNKQGMPQWLVPVFDQVWDRVTAPYAKIGLRWIRNDNATNYNIDFNFVPSSAGWIGLAILGRNQNCTSRIWCRYLASYTGGSTTQARMQQWVTLIMHELGHNCGLEHSRGGVMNPSIVPGLPGTWDNDPSLAQLKRWFGGEPLPNVGGPGPQPPTGPIPPGDGPRSPNFQASLRLTIPEGVKPGEYNLVAQPFEGI